MDLSLSTFQEIMKDKEAWHAAVHRVTKSWTSTKILKRNELDTTKRVNNSKSIGWPLAFEDSGFMKTTLRIKSGEQSAWLDFILNKVQLWSHETGTVLFVVLVVKSDSWGEQKFPAAFKALNIHVIIITCRTRKDYLGRRWRTNHCALILTNEVVRKARLKTSQCIR